MYLLGRRQTATLAQMAFDMREDLSFRGAKVTTAMELDPSFRSGQARAGLRRDILKDACRRSASAGGVHFNPIGEGLELVMICEDGVLRRFRLRSAHRNSSGDIVIQHNSQSSLQPVGEDDSSLLRQETWVLGVIIASDVELAEVFAARVIGVEAGKPGKLRLDSLLPLLAPTTPPGDFTPDDEDLDVFGDESDETGTSAA